MVIIYTFIKLLKLTDNVNDQRVQRSETDSHVG